jgi:PAS domain S-box-containing protein
MTKSARRAGQSRYQSLFENVPIAIFEEDFTAVKEYIDDLRAQGVTDFRAYFEDNADAVARCVEMVKIVDVNRAAMKLYRAESKDELLAGLAQIFGEQRYEVFVEELITLAEGGSSFESEAITQTLRGDENHVYLTLSIAPGHEQTWSRVLLSLSDITERKRLDAELRSSQQYLEKLNDGLAEVILTVRLPERAIVYVNRSVRDVLGYEPEECLGRSTEFLYRSHEDYLGFGERLAQVMAEGGDALDAEFPLKRKDGQVFPAEITSTFLREGGRITQVISIARDITERRQAEQALQKSEARLAEAQRIGHLGNWDWDITTDTLLWSDEIYRIFGLQPQEFGATYTAFLRSVHPDDREFVDRSVNEALHDGIPYSIDHRIVLPDGSVRFVHEDAEITRDEAGKPVRMAGTVHDITETKTAEQGLRLLSARLVEIQEDERRAIARELHDEIGQCLTALKMALERCATAAGSDSLQALPEAHGIIDDLMNRVRQLSLELRPRMLDDLGLLPSLLWHFERFTAQTGMRINFEHAGLSREFPQDISTAAYRIAQEALTNVARHAAVDSVDIHVWADQDVLFLRIEDKGRGFVSASKTDYSSFSGGTMQERAFLLGGSVTIETSPDHGTCVLAELPLPPRQEDLCSEGKQ